MDVISVYLQDFYYIPRDFFKHLMEPRESKLLKITADRFIDGRAV